MHGGGVPDAPFTQVDYGVVLFQSGFGFLPRTDQSVFLQGNGFIVENGQPFDWTWSPYVLAAGETYTFDVGYPK